MSYKITEMNYRDFLWFSTGFLFRWFLGDIVWCIAKYWNAKPKDKKETIHIVCFEKIEKPNDSKRMGPESPSHSWCSVDQGKEDKA